MNKPASKLIMPKHIWDGNKKEKIKKDIEKVPQPTGYRLVLFPLKLESKTAGGVHLLDSVVEQASIATNICKVIAVGPDAYLDKDKFPKGAWCKKDDWIIIAKYAGARLSIDGGELRIINDDEVLAVVEDPRDILPANLI
jgi:co-chaperonin GroES (HSP10)